MALVSARSWLNFPQREEGAGCDAMQTSQRNGDLVGAVQVFGSDEVMLISNLGFG